MAQVKVHWSIFYWKKNKRLQGSAENRWERMSNSFFLALWKRKNDPQEPSHHIASARLIIVSYCITCITRRFLFSRQLLLAKRAGTQRAFYVLQRATNSFIYLWHWKRRKEEEIVKNKNRIGPGILYENVARTDDDGTTICCLFTHSQSEEKTKKNDVGNIALPRTDYPLLLGGFCPKMIFSSKKYSMPFNIRKQLLFFPLQFCNYFQNFGTNRKCFIDVTLGNLLFFFAACWKVFRVIDC